jgi:succinate dehydrogenase / fumarate reductase, cytochrome b subunit
MLADLASGEMVKSGLVTRGILPAPDARLKRAALPTGGLPNIMARNPNRPLSPHLQIWRWGPGMLVSILHRVTGTGLSVLGLFVLSWWLAAIASGPAAYGQFRECFGHPLGLVVLIGLSWAFFQHLLSGIRHLVMDIGAGFELQANKRFAVLTLVGSVILTLLLWAYLLGVK